MHMCLKPLNHANFNEQHELLTVSEKVTKISSAHYCFLGFKYLSI